MANTHAGAQKSGGSKGAAPGAAVVHNQWVQGLERAGYVARGVLFFVIGFLAVQAALNKPGGNLTDQNGAMAALAAEPFGKALLILMVIGLIGFSLWGLVRAIFDPLHMGHDRKGLIARAGYLVSAFSYGAFVLPFAQIVLGLGAAAPKGQTEKTRDFTAQVLGNPVGAIVIAVVGVAVIAWALGQFYSAYTGKFEKAFQTSKMSATEKQWTLRVGRIGIGARAVVFLLIGFFLIQAALTVDAKQAIGLDAALWKLTQLPQGPIVLAAVAIGLMLFGVYSILAARWLKLD